ncbi:MAG: helix-turn-helix transcriptional regulator [Bacteroidota bacterium]
MKTAKFRIESVRIQELVQKAVNEQHLSLSAIASLAGLSVPTIARIYNGEVSEVQTRTARKIAAGLGYSIDVGPRRVLLEKPTEGKRQARLTAVQKERILKAIMKAMREELEEF